MRGRMIFSRRGFPLRSNHFSFKWISFVLLFAVLPVAQAGRPMAIDDATLTNAKGCELETWTQKNRSSTEYWSLPNCNVNGNLELTLGAGRIVSNDGTKNVGVLQAKTLLKLLEPNGWGAGLVVGNQFNPDKSIAGDWYVNLPVSFSLQDDRFLVHLNSGWLHDKEVQHDLATWGIGSELQITKRTAFTSEIYRQDVGKPFFQLGIRHQLISNLMQIDASYGDHFTGSDTDRFFSIGIVLTVDALVP